jgi:hypothetical protein
MELKLRRIVARLLWKNGHQTIIWDGYSLHFIQYWLKHTNVSFRGRVWIEYYDQPAHNGTRDLPSSWKEQPYA